MVFSLWTRQNAQAFNQPLSFNTSKVTRMNYVFYVRSARALAPNSPVGSSVHVTWAATQRPPVSWPSMSPSWYAPLLTRQGATVFNQPLSFDTSSVTDMGWMFYVRSAQCLV